MPSHFSCVGFYSAPWSLLSYNNFAWDLTLIFFWCSFLCEICFFELLERDGIQECFSSFTGLLSVVLCSLHGWPLALWQFLALSAFLAGVWNYSSPPCSSPWWSILSPPAQSLLCGFCPKREPWGVNSQHPPWLNGSGPSVFLAMDPLISTGIGVSKTPSSFSAVLKRGCSLQGIPVGYSGSSVFMSISSCPTVSFFPLQTTIPA